MNVHISYKAGKTPDVEREFKHQLEKLQRRLQVFKPELVHFHAILELQNGHSAKALLNLRLPSGQMAAQKSGETVLAAVKSSFTDLLSQVNKHKELLRGNWNWKRRRAPGKGRSAAGVPLAPPIAPAQPGIQQAKLENGGTSDWINANLQRLERFVDRELRYRVATEQINEGQISREEVIDEVMVSVLSREDQNSDDLALESWLYRLALRAIRRVAEDNADTATVSLDAPVGVQNVSGSDENVLQYHQPDDSLREESVIRDQTVRTPEEIFASEEMVAQLDLVLREVSPPEREVFVLYALEGFTVEEIARITDLAADRIRKFIQHARARIQRDLPPQNELRQQLLRHSRVA
jgi:RNA polymerase sigma factor (sigma-70 family)